MSVKISMKVNGKPASAEVEARTLLVTFIRENLRLTGTHVGCDTAQCGACTVLMNGKAIKSCSIVAMQAEGADIIVTSGGASLRARRTASSSTRISSKQPLSLQWRGSVDSARKCSS